MTAAVAKLLAAWIAEGAFRTDAEPADVLLLMGFLWRVPATDQGLTQGRRIIDIVLDGLRLARLISQSQESRRPVSRRAVRVSRQRASR